MLACRARHEITMRPWELLDTTTVPGEGSELHLYRRGEEFSIKSGHYELMNSHIHGSEDVLAELACKRLEDKSQTHVLIGGLGMGFTLAAALQGLGPHAEITVAELVPAVIKWNRGLLSSLAGHPLEDKRVTIHEGDVGQLISSEQDVYDAILLDVDNGPEGLTRKENDNLYSLAGLSTVLAALRPGGIFGVWSANSDHLFSKRLKQAGFKVEEIRTPARSRHGGRRHVICLGTKK